MRVRDAQQRFGQAHHGDALVRAEVVSLKKCVDPGWLVGAHALHQSTSDRRCFALSFWIEPRLPNAFGDDLLLVRPVGAP
jgi:hypothetical protein